MKRFRKLLLAEVGIEFKACLYFFAILFFYCVYKMTQGIFQADMLVMAEMILTTYVMGYVQVFLLKNFEESDHLGAGLAFLLSWFDRQWLPEVLFFGYVLLCFISLRLIYYIRRHWDTAELNEELETFKKARKREE